MAHDAPPGPKQQHDDRLNNDTNDYSAIGLQEGDILSPVPFRDEACLHNDASERIYFVDDDTYTLPSRDLEEPLLTAATTDEDVSTTLNSNNHLSSPFSFSRRRQRSSFSDNPFGQLNKLNYLNLLTYLAHLFVSWGIGVWGLDGLVETRWQITTYYESLVTPAEWAYYLWAPILVLEGIFAVAQLVPNYAARPIVQEGTRYFFFYTFVLQTIWTLLFSFKFFVLSFCMVVAALCSLISLLVSQQMSVSGSSSTGIRAMMYGYTGNTSSSNRRSRLEYWLFRFPFYLHAGWMLLMTVDHFSLMFRYYDYDGSSSHRHDTIGLQVGVDIASLGLLLASAIVPLLLWRDFVMATVVLWSFLGIASRLHSPSDLMLELYGPVVIDAMRTATYFFAGTDAICVLPTFVVWIFREFCTIQVVELVDE